MLLIGSLTIAADNAGNSGKPGTETEATQPGRFGETIDWQVISSGGTDGSSTNYQLMGTAGQTAVGTGSSTNYGLNQGYWQEFAVQECDCIPGDADGNAMINIADVVYLINFIFGGGPGPVPYAICSGDADCNCMVNIADVVFLISFIFGGGPAPCTCEEWLSICGPPMR